MTRRNFNLDVVRAAAVTMVVLGHMAVMSPVRRPWALTAAWVGQFGVDLFFVLSGWLIGGLFWAEHKETGTVNWSRFFLRRALRTMPPYFIIMPLAWLAVHRFAPTHPAFDPSYLLFLQNYREKIPYYAISWSLCVEEHFYLAFPLLTLLILAWRVPPACLFAALFLVSPCCRLFFETGRNFNDFNRSVLATHLRLDGLVLGFWAAHIRTCQGTAWRRLSAVARWTVLPAIAVLALSPFIPDPLFYLWGPTLMAAIFLVVVVHAANAAPWRLPGAAGVQKLALMSYSIYLTHSLLIHVARAIALHREGAEVLYWVAGLLLIGVAGWLFSRWVEIPSIRLRDRLAPGRPRMSAAPA